MPIDVSHIVAQDIVSFEVFKITLRGRETVGRTSAQVLILIKNTFSGKGLLTSCRGNKSTHFLIHLMVYLFKHLYGFYTEV